MPHLDVLLARTAPDLQARVRAVVGGIDPSVELTFVPLAQSVKESLENAVIGAAIAADLLRRFLLGLSPADPVSYAIVAVVLATAALVGAAIPVRRALRVDPALTLKTE